MRAISRNASSGTAIFSAAAIKRSRSKIFAVAIVRNSNCWQREIIVYGNFPRSVVAIMNTTRSGGSSTVFKSALKEWFESMCTSSMMKIL